MKLKGKARKEKEKKKEIEELIVHKRLRCKY